MWHRNGLWWEISRFTAVSRHQTFRAFLQLKDERVTVVAFSHHVGIDTSCQCFGRKKLAFLNRTMWCSKLMMCCKKTSSFLFTTQFPFYYRPFSIYFSILRQHHFQFLFPFYDSTIFIFLFTTAPNFTSKGNCRLIY